MKKIIMKKFFTFYKLTLDVCVLQFYIVTECIRDEIVDDWYLKWVLSLFVQFLLCTILFFLVNKWSRMHLNVNDQKSLVLHLFYCKVNFIIQTIFHRKKLPGVRNSAQITNSWVMFYKYHDNQSIMLQTKR